MTSDKIRELVKREPFSPFSIHMNDGRKLDVNHPDFIAIHPEARNTVAVDLSGSDFASCRAMKAAYSEITLKNQ